MTSKVLKLYNTFTKTLNNVELNGKIISPSKSQQPIINGSFYICGPTVYDNCHVGHAITYIRADLFRRFMKSMFNVRLQTVMNITDIDDKILNRTYEELQISPLEHEKKLDCDPQKHPFNIISDKYFRNFLRDLNLINVLPADIYVKISKHINLISNFIRKLEKNGNAYIAPNDDIYFRVKSIENYVGRMDNRNITSSLDNNDNLNQCFRKENDKIKQDPRDFVLWKKAKSNEPIWQYKSSLDNRIILGRPGWHVQCSAISSAIFGNKLDFHFGGKDLIFPHHYNEQACCCAYHQLDTSNNLNVWSNHWLHSGHLILRDSSEKMSKSLGNVVEIKNFIGRSSVNALRLLCILTHYRTDVTYNDELFDKLKALDHKINAFNSYLGEELRNRQDSLTFNHEYYEENNNMQSGITDDIDNYIESTQNSIIDGICDDFHLDKGLDSIISLSKVIYSKDVRSIKTRNLMTIWSLLSEWCNTSGLSYGMTTSTTTNTSTGDTISSLSGSSTTVEESLQLLSDFRNKVRVLVLDEIKKQKEIDNKFDRSNLNNIMEQCDNVRSKLNEIGFVPRDPKSS